MRRLSLAVLTIVFLVAGCGQGTINSIATEPPQPVTPIPLSQVDHVTVEAFLVDKPKTPINTTVISTGSAEQTLIHQINASRTEPLPKSGTMVVAPEVGPTSVSYTVLVSLKDGDSRVFSLGSWGPTFDVNYGVDLNPGISRTTLKTLSSGGEGQK